MNSVTYPLSVHQLHRLDQIQEKHSIEQISAQSGEIKLGKLSLSRFSALRFKRFKNKA